MIIHSIQRIDQEEPRDALLQVLTVFAKTPLSTNDLNIQFKGAASPGSLADCLGTLARDPEVAMPRVAACTDEMFICFL